MADKTTISIFGACVSKDVFDITKTDAYKIEQCVSFISPMSLTMKTPKCEDVLTPDKFKKAKGSAFSLRCLCLDESKQAFSYLQKKQSDWLLLDIADCRFSIATFPKSNVSLTFSNSFIWNQSELEDIFQESFQKKPYASFSEEEWDSCIHSFIDEILKMYEPSNIIFHEYYHVYDYISKDETITNFKPETIAMRKKQNAFLQKLNQKVKEQLAGCHIIQMPDHVFANADHKWGKHPMHYVDAYYEYARRAIDVITAKKPLQQEQTELALLQELYTQKFIALRQSYQLKKPLAGKTAVVTGASGEIGSSCCFRLAKDGAKIAVCGRNTKKLQAVVNKIRASGGIAEAYAFDVTDVMAIHNNFKAIYEKFGSLDILINNAGASERNRSKYLYNQSPEVIDEMLMLNLRAAMLCTRKAFQFMIKKDDSPEYGKVINIASVVGVQGRIRLSSYSAAKSGLLGFTKSVALEMGHHNITVNCVSPGIIVRGKVTGKNKEAIEKTNCMHVIPPTESISSAVAFLVSQDADMITGQNLIVDAGRSLGLIGDNN